MADVLQNLARQFVLPVTLVVLLVTSAGTALAQSGRLEVQPATATLTNSRARQQFVATWYDAAGNARDVTSEVNWSATSAATVQIQGGVAVPVSDGAAEVIATFGDRTASSQVTVTGSGTALPVSFDTEVLGALTKAGCNMGACHGSPSGKGGFRLSLRGYDAPFDLRTLRKEFDSRRINLFDPDASLLLRKPLMEVSHGGGRRLHVGDAPHAAIREWIAEGMKTDEANTARLERIEILPHGRILQFPADRQQLIVQGYFTNGEVRDVTPLTVFSSSSEAVASVSEAGLVEKQSRGETAILARYLDKMDTVEIKFLEDVPGFQWNDPAELNFIDQHVNAKLRQLQILPANLCSDDEFIRRVTLDVAGRLPTVAETQAFLADGSENKRTVLIDRLLASADYANFWGLKWSDVLRANSGALKPEGVAKFNLWVRDSVDRDQPMDEFARELLTATGSVFENPAANYWRASRDPNDATETTAQLFLGIRIQCAKCHNHPFERWTQDNYYGIGAAFARVGRKTTGNKMDELIFVKRDGEVTQPRTGKTMPVHLLLQGDVEVTPEKDRRAVFAEWLTADDNPFFARSIANRIWGHLLGRGIVEPVDDFRDSNPPSNAALLDALASEFIAHGYSRRWLIRTILLSHTYQRSARTNEFNEADELYFSHATTRMLTAEQLLDAICAVTQVPEQFAGMPAGFRATQLPEPPTDHYFLKVFGQPQRQMACECERSSESNLGQALQMINGPTVHNKLRDDAGRIKRLLDAGADDATIVTELYLSAVSREPDTAEMQAALAHISASENRRWALEDIGWAVLNTKEFLFQH
ncbi:MAG: DUF1549 and DUF1553 domain-containing protein [Planctomycetaceae bacterium]